MKQNRLFGNLDHREVFNRALRNGVEKGDLTQYQADKLRREYGE